MKFLVSHAVDLQWLVHGGGQLPKSRCLPSHEGLQLLAGKVKFWASGDSAAPDAILGVRPKYNPNPKGFKTGFLEVAWTPYLSLLAATF